MNDNSNSEIVFSSRRYDERMPSLKNSKIEGESVSTTSEPTKKILYQESSDLSSSGTKGVRKGSDDSISESQTRKIDQLQKYNVFIARYTLFI